jgi:hypothetical protein
VVLRWWVCSFAFLSWSLHLLADIKAFITQFEITVSVV